MRRILAYAVILIVAGACTLGEIMTDYGDPADMSPADLAGTWHGGAQRWIIFKDDETFIAKELPYEAVSSFVPKGFDPSSQMLNGSGTWSLEAPDNASHERKSSVRLSFERLADTDNRFGYSMDALRQDDGVVSLFLFHGGRSHFVAYRKFGGTPG
jgi:hypothetical protein